MARRLGLHALALALALVALSALVGTDGLVSADEGAMLAQLDLVEASGEWHEPNPEPVVDPAMFALPLELSDRSVDGDWAPFVKHPAHIAVLGPFWAVGGYGGTLALSIAGVVAAAWASGLLARRLAPGTEVAALWATGIGSPLLFDSFQVVGHAVGAGLFGLSAAAALAALDATAVRSRVVLGAASVGAAAAAALVRSEAVLAAVALGVAVVAFGRSAGRVAFVLGAALVAAGAAVRLGEPRLVDAALGAASAGTTGGPATSGGFLAGRWAGFRVTVLDAGYGVDDGEGLLLVAVVLAVAAALVWRLRRDTRLVRVLAVGAVAAAVGRMLLASFLVPGLLLALPLLAVALASLEPSHVRHRSARVVWAASAMFAASVVATQYDTGGTGEWGGRYFAIALPLLAAGSVQVLQAAGAAMPAPTRRLVAGALVVLSATLAVGSVRATERARAGSDAAATAVIGAVDDLDVEATVSTRGAVSRFAWDDVLDGRRWFTTGAAQLAALGEALADDGVTRVALVVPASADLDGALGARWEVGLGVEVRPGTVVAVATAR